MTVLDSLTAGQVDDVRSLIDRATEADEVGPMSEDGRLHLSHQVPGIRHLVAAGRDGDGVIGYAQLDVRDPAEGGHAELVVTPASRGVGIGRALARSLVAEAPSAGLGVWAHGDLPAAAHLAREFGFERTRELWQMRRSLAEPLPDVMIPRGVTVRTFLPGADEEAWLALNAAAFATHPEQGSWTADDLRLREDEPWFDPQGFFLAEQDERLVGFHWTKVHPAGPGTGELGEIYVLGVHPEASGRGLGSLLSLVGLHHLRGRGLDTVLLYVEAENTGAIRVYTKLGFTRFSVDVAYHRP